MTQWRLLSVGSLGFLQLLNLLWRKQRPQSWDHQQRRPNTTFSTWSEKKLDLSSTADRRLMFHHSLRQLLVSVSYTVTELQPQSESLLSELLFYCSACRKRDKVQDTVMFSGEQQLPFCSVHHWWTDVDQLHWFFKPPADSLCHLQIYQHVLILRFLL